MPTLTPKLYRDDDVSVYTCPREFKELHQKFIEKKQVHTVAVLMKDLWENHSLFYYLATAPYLKVELHGWTHKDYSKLNYQECFEDLEKSIWYWKENCTRMVKKCNPITTFFAPWNRESETIRQACSELGLSFCNVKKGIWHNQEIHSFHYWSADNFKLE